MYEILTFVSITICHHVGVDDLEGRFSSRLSGIYFERWPDHVSDPSLALFALSRRPRTSDTHPVVVIPNQDQRCAEALTP